MERNGKCEEVKKSSLTRKNEFGYFVINYHFYYAVNPNPKFIAKNIKLFRWDGDNKYKILNLKTRTFYLFSVSLFTIVLVYMCMIVDNVMRTIEIESF